MAFFQAHQLPQLETVSMQVYERVVTTTMGTGWFQVEHDAKRNSVLLSLWNGTENDLKTIADSVIRMFDLNPDLEAIEHAMKKDSQLAAIWTQHAGLRVARSWDGFQSMLTTILGQVVSVSFGRILTDELMKAAGTRTRHPKTGETIHLFPVAEQLLSADLTAVRTSEARRIAIRSLAKLVAEGELPIQDAMPPKELRRILQSVPGVGAWTCEYVAMRGFHDDDAFPATDYGLKQELKRHPGMDVNRVRPFRAYAAAALWRTFAATKGAPCESVV